VYAREFKLLGVVIDNKLKQLANNFEGRKKKIRIKIAIWRKLNLSEIGNLIISKTFLISQLGYLLSMMECPAELMATIQLDIDRFIFRTGKNPWMAEGRRYLPPSEGGMGAINIVTYAQSLRCSWYKRIMDFGLISLHPRSATKKIAVLLEEKTYMICISQYSR
jgi:hypothetical protein